jgi:hypothetical protein
MRALGVAMAHIACLCGNDVRENNYENVWTFVSDSLMDEFADSQPFFGLDYRRSEKTEIWHCGDCDRLIIFDNADIYVTRYMRRALGSAAPFEANAHRGIFYNEELFFDEVEKYFVKKLKNGEAPDYEYYYADWAEGKPLLTPRIMHEDVFHNQKTAFRYWFRATLSEQSLVIYGQEDTSLANPLKVWRLSVEDTAKLKSDQDQ